MTTMDGAGAVTPMADDSPAMGLLQTIREEAKSGDERLEETEVDQVDIEAPSEPAVEAEPEEKPADEQPTDEYIEIPGEDGKEARKIAIKDAIAAYDEYQALEGKVDQVIAQVEERTQARATQVFEAQDKALKDTIDTLTVWHTGLQQMAPRPPDVSLLDPNSEKYDPDGYHRSLAYHQKVVGAFAQIDQQIKNANAERDRLANERQEQLAEAEMQRLYRHDPEWKTNFQGVANEVMSVLADKYGMDEKTMMSIVDHRFFRIARDAVKFHKMQASSGQVRKAVEAKPRLVKSQTASAQRAQPAQARGQNGRYVSDAAKALREGPYTQEKGVNFFESLIRNKQL